MNSVTEETPTVTPRPPAVKINTIGFGDVRAALAAGWRDFLAAPLIGLFFGGIYAAGGIAIFLLLKVYHEPWWIIPIAVGFPLIGPFVAVGLYETSRRIAAGQPLEPPGRSWPAGWSVLATTSVSITPGGWCEPATVVARGPATESTYALRSPDCGVEERYAP